MKSNDDYFSGDEVAFFISKVFFCDRFTRNVFCFLSLKDVAQRLATYKMDESPRHSICHTHALWSFRKGIDSICYSSARGKADLKVI